MPGALQKTMCSIIRVLAIICGFCALLLVPPILPAQYAQQPAPVNAPDVIKSYVNEVLVPVVVRDSHGQSIGSLTKQDFQVFDEGKPQVITGFSIVDRAAKAPAPGVNPSTRASSTAETSPPASPAPRFVVFLFDDLDLKTSDLAQAQQAATKFLNATLPPSDMAAVLSTSGRNSGLTRDRAVLQKAILDLRANNLYSHSDSDCPNVEYYQADLIIEKNNDRALEAATEDALSCLNLDRRQIDTARQMARQAAQRAVAVGEQDYRANLSFMKTIVSKMAHFPGQRLLILVSPGFLTPTAEALTLQSQVLDAAAQANVVINAIDARGLYTTTVDASQRGGDSAMVIAMKGQYKQASMIESENVMADLADGTGGSFFHSNNDLQAGLNSLVSEPRYLYLLTFSPTTTKANGAYHGLKVKVDRSGVSLKARRGYFAPAPEKKHQ
jgi:VWFA-related protein